MMITIADVLGADELQAISAALADDALFENGAATAGEGAQAVKHNLQGRAQASPVKAVTEKVRRALLNNAVFAAAALPLEFARVQIGRYTTGMTYGWHADEAFIDKVRTDLSFTLFLSEPSDYDGGDLEIATSAGIESVRLPAGSAVVYASGAMHRVTAVTSGERLVVVGWVRSRIRSAEQREVQFKLASALSSVGHADPAETARELGGIRQELLRMWACD